MAINKKSYEFIKQEVAAGNLFLDMYIYQAKVPAIAAGASVTVQVNIEADAPFMWDKASVFASLAGVAQTDSSRVLPQIDVAITDSGSGRNLQAEPVQVSNVAGTGELPYVLPQPRVFSPNSTITFTFTNTGVENYTNFQFSLIGRKAFRY